MELAVLMPLAAGRTWNVPGDLRDPGQSAFQRVLDAASRKGVTLDILQMPGRDRTSEETAAAVHADLGQIVGTTVLVAPGPGGRLTAIVCLMSGRNRVDPRLVAAVTGKILARPAVSHEVSDLTGYSAGAMPPFGHGRGIPVVMDQDLCRYEAVWAAAGTDSAIFRVTPRTLQMLAGAVVARVH
jgi:prolyl-tRNA editing enzyme YbaK/EbsC (Cys-tRNA(Pro) deacylase)